MKFKEWFKKIQLQEVGTSTSSVAVFSRPIFGGNMIRRTWAPFTTIEPEDDEKYKKRKNKD
jgi:hypothetical protein